MNIERRLIHNFDWLWLLAVLLLSGAGLVAIWSVTNATGWNSYLGRHVIFLGLALAFFLLILYFDYHVYADFVAAGYVLAIAVLVLVLLVGRTIHSNKSWIYLAGISVQPSEFVKILVIVALARYYSEVEGEYLGLRELAIGGLIVLLPVGLVVLQGDLGTAITYIPIYAALSLLAGLRRRHLLLLTLAAAVALPGGWLLLRDYQKSRIESVLNPASDPLHRGYQAVQSQIAVGSGRFLGKGFKQGSQSQLGFLPARQNDFVFAVISEERGFVGSMTVLSLLLFICLRLLRAAREAKDKVGTMIVAGVLGLFLFHATVNVGMVVGLVPIVGIPLPLVSAGGSALISFFAAMSLCMNVHLRRFVN